MKSMRDVMGDEPYSDEEDGGEEMSSEGDAETELITELGEALRIDESTARRVYDVICAVVESKAGGASDSEPMSHGPSSSNGKKGKPAVAIVLGR